MLTGPAHDAPAPTDGAGGPALREVRARAQELLAARIPVHLGRLSWDAEALAAHQGRALGDLLRHAAEHSRFHAGRFGDVDLATVTPDDLRRLPVMTKADLAASFDDVVTDRRVTRSRVEEVLAATGDTPRLLADEYLCLASGGSSGVRGVYVWHWSALVDYALGMLRAGLARVVAGGGPPAGGLLTAMVTAGSAVHATRALPALLSGEVLRAEQVPVTLPFEEVVARLNALQPVLLQAYPSILGRLAAARRAGTLAIAPMGVTATSETLPTDLRADVADAFGVPVTDQFGSSEGLVGAAPPEAEGIVLADDLAVVELVDDHDRPVPTGTPSHSVLVTSLLNRVQPLVRFRLEDRMVALPSPAGTGWTVVRVEGRSDDVLRFGDRTLHPLVVRSVLARCADVAEYQVHQTSGGLRLDVVPAGAEGPGTAGLAEQVRAATAAAGLPDLTVDVRTVAAVPRDPSSGKARRFVPA